MIFLVYCSEGKRGDVRLPEESSDRARFFSKFIHPYKHRFGLLHVYSKVELDFDQKVFTDWIHFCV